MDRVGPYLLADGQNPRSDGLTWQPTDLAADGTHLKSARRQKQPTLLMRHLINTPHANSWFLRYRQGDADTNGSIDGADLRRIDTAFNNQTTQVTSWLINATLITTKDRAAITPH